MFRTESKPVSSLFFLNDDNVGQVLLPEAGRTFAVGGNCFTIAAVYDKILCLSKWGSNSQSIDDNVNYILSHAQPRMIERDRFLYLAGPVPEADSDAILHEVSDDTVPQLPASPWFSPPSPPYVPNGPASSHYLFESSPSFTPELSASDQTSSPFPCTRKNLLVFPLTDFQLEPPHSLLDEASELTCRPRSLANNTPKTTSANPKKRRSATQLGPGSKKAATSSRLGFTVSFVMKFSPWRI